eukprot:CAMPEP_0184695454 /NCGR_PEP_ID=MMETSP0313-20130426/3072_1 /TAXON_ID=2792 /ORGANISM="Porphyridium aerugineum, Strain SAG 1380-2" /LENGTH=423 /DNA_ID=CAMNT_0027153905 /DNA_START=211 /DNA_END=1482 /DNA_ORIENTATION=-
MLGFIAISLLASSAGSGLGHFSRSAVRLNHKRSLVSKVRAHASPLAGTLSLTAGFQTHPIQVKQQYRGIKRGQVARKNNLEMRTTLSSRETRFTYDVPFRNGLKLAPSAKRYSRGASRTSSTALFASVPATCSDDEFFGFAESQDGSGSYTSEPVSRAFTTIPTSRSGWRSNFEIDSGAFMIPHPDKEESGGEDALFTSQYALGVFDGVGGWANIGIDSGEFSRRLAAYTLSHLEVQDERELQWNIPKAIHDACSDAEADTIGSATACVVALDKLNPDFLIGANVGDSTLVIVRENNVVYRSPEQQHYFNCPYQIGTDTGWSAVCDSYQFSQELKHGDLIVLGTDGLFDNLFEYVLLDHLSDKTHTEPDELAKSVAELAFEVAMNPKSSTPFGMNARKAGYLYVGGKPDDISVVVARVLKRSK